MHDGAEPNGIASPFNERQLLINCMCKPTLAALVLEKFEIQLRDDLAKMVASAEARNLAELARVAHGLKGAAAACTATNVEAVAERVETAARGDEAEVALTAFRELQAEIDQCLRALPATRTSLVRT